MNTLETGKHVPPQNVNSLKASLFNLIVYVREKRRLAYINDVLQGLIQRFPCRIIFIECDPQTNQHLQSSSSMQYTSNGGSTIAYDRIDITASADRLRDVPVIVLPYLIPDLPIHLLWAQDPINDFELFQGFHEFSRRMVFDSESVIKLQPFSEKLLQLIHGLKMDIIDINWARKTSWRRILAQVFDNQEKIDRLTHCKRITLCYNNAQRDDFKNLHIQPMYMQAWLAAQLNWRFVCVELDRGSVQSVRYDHGGGEVTVSLVPEVHEKITPGGITAIDIQCDSKQAYSLRRKESLSSVNVEVKTTEKDEPPFTLMLPNFQRSLTFIREILYAETSPQYISMLHMLSKITDS